MCVYTGGGGAFRVSFCQSGLFSSAYVRNDSRPCVGDERRLRILAHVRVQEHISRVRTLLKDFHRTSMSDADDS